MKIRIQSSSIRFRLSKTDVEQLTDEGRIEEQTPFESSVFSYAVQQSRDVDQLTASFENNKITLLVPAVYVEDWAINTIIGFDAKMQVGTGETLFLLLEKDFKCLDLAGEDQSDNYENPKTNC
jgi:hypothetical protein